MGALGASAVSAAILTLTFGIAGAQNVAELFGKVAPSVVWRLEAARQDPTLTVLEKIARALKVPIGRLLK